MMHSTVMKIVASYYRNLYGWRTNRKIVVIESDDWGSIRMPSKDVYYKCLNAGYEVDQNAYEQFDSLASEEDIEMLFNLLIQFKDSKGMHPVITANVLPANPDFDSIQESDFKEYYYELITETFYKYPYHKNCFNLWKEGIQQKIFFPHKNQVI